MNESITEKVCITCKDTKPISEFCKQKSKPDGFYPACKECERKRNYRYYLEHAEKLREYARKYRSENREASREYTKRYREENPEKAKAAKKKYRRSLKGILKEKEYKTKYNLKNAEKGREYSRKYYREHPGHLQSYRSKNPEKILSWKRNRSARVRGNGGKITLEEWQNILEKYGQMCLCCKKKDVKLTMDHIIPLKLGGKHTVDNVQPLCQSCNSRKHVSIVDYRSAYYWIDWT